MKTVLLEAGCFITRASCFDDRRLGVRLVSLGSELLMLENGAEVRYLQALLGHESLRTTQVYTHVSIPKLREVHRKTHPARLSRQESPEQVDDKPGDDDLDDDGTCLPVA